MSGLAINGGKPVRETVLPYGRQCIDDDDVSAVIKVLQADYLTTGPKVAEFEKAFADQVGAKEAVAVSNGTAALHAAIYSLDIRPGDEIIVPSMTFAASANCAIYQGARPVFVDVEFDTLLIDADEVASKVTDQTKAIMAVDFAGQPCDYDSLQSIADRFGLAIVADACHALGGSYKQRSVGTLADLNAFSLHPVKHITTGEGGIITTDDPSLAQRMRIFRNHGINTDHRQREAAGSWFYEMIDLGYNYRLTDFQCAMGLSQLRKLDSWVMRRQEIAGYYNSRILGIPAIGPLRSRDWIQHSYHLYVTILDEEHLRVPRSQIFSALRAEGIGVNVHYIPVHLHPYYRKNFATGPGLAPVAESAYERILSLPIFPSMNENDIEDVLTALEKVMKAYLR